MVLDGFSAKCESFHQDTQVLCPMCDQLLHIDDDGIGPRNSLGT